MANTKFYYNGQVVRTSATKTYTHAVLVAHNDGKGKIALEDGRTAGVFGCCGRPDLVQAKVDEASQACGSENVVVVELTTEEPTKAKKSSKKVTKTASVIVYTFTGMKIQGVHKAVLNNGEWVVEFNKGVTHTFDSKTMKQTDSNNFKFANRVEIVSC